VRRALAAAALATGGIAAASGILAGAVGACDRQADANGLPDQAAWLDDPRIWTRVEGTEFLGPDCAVYEARPGAAKFPLLAWEPCGPGCEAAALGQDLGDRAALPTASTHIAAGAPAGYLAMTHGIETAGGPVVLRRVLRLDDGVTLGALELRQRAGLDSSPCVFGNGRESALSSDVQGRSAAPSGQAISRRIHARAAVDGGPWTWARPGRALAELPRGRVQFDLDDGRLFTLGLGSVWTMADPSVGRWSPLEATSTAERGAGQGDLAVWIDRPARGAVRIRGWSPDGRGVRTVVADAPAGTCEIVATPAHVIGLALGAGADSCRTSSTLAIWSSPRAPGSSPPPIARSPVLHAAGFAPQSFKAWGDFAAALLWPLDSTGQPRPAPFFLVVRLSTWEAWRLDPQPGRAFHADGWTLTDRYLYAGESGDVYAENFWIRRMTRVALDRLDAAADRIKAP
jgi:hypothetical protein